jgi:imidazolonepropionase
MLIHSCSQLLTLAGGPQRGQDLGKLGIIEDGAVLLQDEHIAAVGQSQELLAAYPDEPRWDARGHVVMPGFVDAHTHLIWAGDRAAEFEMRLQGKTYLEIQAAGGGILSTVRATRAAETVDLLAQTRQRIQALVYSGTTTAEVKTGYGLDTATELNLLDLLTELDDEGPLEIIPTFMGAHALPPEYPADPQGYTDLVCREMLPAVLSWMRNHAPEKPLPFVDVFCEQGAFDLAQSRQILSEAKRLGFPLKIHTDEFANLGGTRMAVELGAASADHLVKISPEEIKLLAQSNTVAVALPCTPFGLAEGGYTPARALLAAGGLLAIASDINPGTAWCESMQFVIALACRALKLTPAQAIAAATLNAAAALGCAERIGSIETGKQADVLILSVADYRHLGYRFGGNLVDQVVKKGIFLDHLSP